jgi:ABC-type spermidine/putrescine transport system permease subunit II
MASATRSLPRPTRRPWRQVNPLALFAVVMFLFLLAPTIVVAIMSLSSSPYLEFPPPALSLRWYRTFLQDARLTEAFFLSLRIGIVATVLAVVIGTLASLALTRYTIRAANVVRLLILAPLIVPYIVQAVGLFRIFLLLGLRGTVASLVIAHTVIAIPYVVLVVSAGLMAVPKSLEEASRVLGASAFTTVRRITLPLIAPSIAASAVFAFITSWDEFIIAFFLAGATTETLPIRMFLALRDQIDPRLSAISTLLIIINFAAVLFFTRYVGGASRSA